MNLINCFYVIFFLFIVALYVFLFEIKWSDQSIYSGFLILKKNLF